ncbi:MAG: hypothetical protein ACXWQO_17825 [Bdellovibrionota bacterium]
MKLILILNLAFSLLAGNAFAAQQLSCSYKGSQQKFAAGVKELLRADISALKEKGIPVVDSSIQLSSAFVSADPSQDPAYLKLKGSFHSETNTQFVLAFDFFPRDGFLGTPKDMVGYYSRLQYDELDAEGNPVNGHCFLESNATVLVRNTKTNAVVAKIPMPAYQVN